MSPRSAPRLAALALTLQAATSLAQTFTYRPPGELVSGSGRGRVDTTVYAPGIRFPIEVAPAYANSQVWGRGGASGPGGSQCDAANYAYPWHDNYCETRSWDMPLCPAGVGHQGQDIRPSTCRDNYHYAVAAANGRVTNIGSYSVYVTADDGTRYDYLHMRSVSVAMGERVTRGQRVGRVSNNFGGTPTTIHLHFNIHEAYPGRGMIYVPTYMSLVRAYEDLTGAACRPSTEVCDGRDNDCDGMTDEGLAALTCGVGACRRTAEACVRGAPGTCTPGTPAARETCGNAIDDNCNGTADEGCVRDAGTDTGARDTGVPLDVPSDTARVDVPRDTAPSDTGAPDTGAPDTGTPDTGAPDTGAPDTGTPDAGAPEPEPSPEGGCGCEASAPSGSWASVVAGALLVTALRRRRRRG